VTTDDIDLALSAPFAAHARMATPEQLADARAWVADCTWLDDTSGLGDAAIVAGVQRHYEGGWAAFLADAR
jgi:hypothetical protein